MNNKIILLVAILLFSFSVFASITNYAVPTEVPLGQVLTIDGELTPAVEDIECSFRLYNSDGNFVYRLTSETTDPSGIFSTSYFIVSEPLLKRDFDYNVVTDCDGNVDSSVFTVEQRENFVHIAEQETLFFFDRGNWEVFYIFGSIFLLIIALIIIFLFWAKMVKSK